MKRKRKLLLHVGTHKTGSTSLQHQLSAHREHLLSKGVCYPLTNRPPLPNKRKHRNLHAALTNSPAAFAQEKAILLDEFAQSGAETLLLSGEGLWRLSAKAMGLLREMTEDFDIAILCYLRRQDMFLESWWNQQCKEGKMKDHIDAFVRRPRHSRGPDYAAQLDLWANFSAVTAIGFEHACKVGLIESFNAVTGLDLPPDPGHRNVSPDMRVASIMAGLNRRGVAQDWQRIESRLKGPRQRHAVGARLRAEILERSAPGNARLARRHGVEFPDELPDEPDEPIDLPTEKELDRIQAMNGYANRIWWKFLSSSGFR